MHLDAKKYEALLAGTLSPSEARSLAQHLSGDCDICEQFLASREAADDLDGRADAAILRAAPAAPRPENELEFARIQRILRSERRGKGRLLAVGAVAASLVAIAVAGLVTRHVGSTPDESWDGVKGAGATAPAVHLRFARLQPGGEPQKGINGETVDRGATLMFEVESNRAANVALARLAPDGAVELLWSQHVGSGRTVLGAQGKTAAYPLAAEGGRQRFVLVGAFGALDGQLVERAVRTLAAGTGGDGARVPKPLSYDMVVVNVR